MASVFEHEGRWTAKFKNERNKWVTRSCGGVDKATAKEWARDWEKEARDLRDGRVDPRTKAYRAAALRPLAEHIADFRAMLAAKGNTPEHVAETTAHVQRIAKDIGAEHIADLSADAVRKAVAAIRDGGRALRTCNAILRSVKTFAGWLEANGRARENELKHVKGYNDKTDRRRVRRDLADDELARLIAAAEGGPVSFGLTGKQRAMAYKVAAGTGFRRDEIASMTKASFTLDGDAPTVKVAAAYSKRRRADEQPIDPTLADALAGFLEGKADNVALLPLPRKTAEMLRGDMRRARARWIREVKGREERRERRKSGYLATVDGEGRVFDFHALRHHYISRVVQSGASVKVCQELARHSTPVLTLGRYAHVRLADLRKAVPTIPTSSKPTAEPMQLRATGTDDATPDRTTPAGATPAQQTTRETGRNSAMAYDGTGKIRLAGSERESLVFSQKSETPPHSAGSCVTRGRRGSNPQPPDRQSGNSVQNPRENETFPSWRYTGATNGPDFAIVAAAWPTLPVAIRAGILAMVKAAKAEGKA